MLEYKLTLHKEVKYFLALFFSLLLITLFTTTPEYHLYIHYGIGIVIGFSFSLFLVKRLFRIKLFNVYQDEVEGIDKEAIMRVADYQKLFHITKIFIDDIKKINELDELKLRFDIYLKTFENNHISNENDIEEYINKIKEYLSEIELSVKKGHSVNYDYPNLIQNEFAKVVENRLTREYKDKFAQIKQTKF